MPIFLARSMELLFVLGSIDGGREMEAGLGTLDERDGVGGGDVECILGAVYELGGARVLVRPRGKVGGAALVNREKDPRLDLVERAPDTVSGS